MPGTPQRRHYKIHDLPEDLLAEVHNLFVSGVTYAQIVSHLQTLGHEISKSAVARYGQHFLARYERLKISGEMARTIVNEAGPDTNMEEAATKLALDLIMQKLLDTDQLQEEFDICKALTALARVQSSGVQREKFKADVRKVAQQTAEDVVADVRQAGLSDAAAEAIKKKILGIAA